MNGGYGRRGRRYGCAMSGPNRRAGYRAALFIIGSPVGLAVSAGTRPVPGWPLPPDTPFLERCAQRLEVPGIVRP
ncbi:hypothetical protein C4J96_0180 [Pseudomonas orientalis]|nr:hypothetical protein C4J96_0180 [Pseudomonas orientalis]